MRCFKCGILGHYAAECRKPRRARELKQEVNIATIEDDETALLLEKFEKNGKDLDVLNKGKVTPKLVTTNQEKIRESNTWYLYNGARNHMTGDKSKFNVLNEEISGNVRFGDRSTIRIEGKGSIKFSCKNWKKELFRMFITFQLCATTSSS